MKKIAVLLIVLVVLSVVVVGEMNEPQEISVSIELPKKVINELNGNKIYSGTNNDGEQVKIIYNDNSGDLYIQKFNTQDNKKTTTIHPKEGGVIVRESSLYGEIVPVDESPTETSSTAVDEEDDDKESDGKETKDEEDEEEETGEEDDEAEETTTPRTAEEVRIQALKNLDATSVSNSFTVEQNKFLKAQNEANNLFQQAAEAQNRGKPTQAKQLRQQAEAKKAEAQQHLKQASLAQAELARRGVSINPSEQLILSQVANDIITPGQAADEYEKIIKKKRAELAVAKKELEEAEKAKEEAIPKADKEARDKAAAEKAAAEAEAAGCNEEDCQKPGQAAQDKQKEIEELEAQKEALAAQSTWIDTITTSESYKAIKEVGSYFGAVGQFASAFGSYRSLSNLLLPDSTAAWMEYANNEYLNMWADLPNFAAREACGVDEEKKREQPGQTAAFIHTIGGTYQFVGRIQAEKSPLKAPILCQKNPDEESTEEFICKGGLECREDQFCYHSNKDTPAKGYFYKITWAVAAPADEKLTPYIDENGIAVKFNVQLQGGSDPYIFTRRGYEPEEVLELINGGRDGGIIVRFLEEDYDRVCIKFRYKEDDDHNAPIDSEGDIVKDICTNFIETDKGNVEYTKSEKRPTVASSSPEVEMTI